MALMCFSFATACVLVPPETIKPITMQTIKPIFKNTAESIKLDQKPEFSMFLFNKCKFKPLPSYFNIRVWVFVVTTLTGFL